MKTQTKLNLMRAGGVTSTFGPLATAVAINHETYFASRAAGWSLTIGGIIAVILVAIAVAGKAGQVLGGNVKVFGIIWGMSILLEPIILNLQFLSGLLFFGACGNKLIFAPQVKKLEARLGYETGANVMKEALNGRT